jgi:branched-chain amino acid transport system permease protein
MSYLADVGITILIYVMLGLSLNLLLGYAGQVSMAQATFFGIGAYTAGLLTMPVLVAASTGIAARGVTSGQGWNWLPGLIIALLVAFLFASVISAPAARRVTGEYLILLTLAFQVIANQLMNSLTNVTGGPYGLTPIPPFNGFGHTYIQPESVFWIVLAFTVVSFLVARGIAESPFGRVLKGVREDEVAVRALGKNTVRTKIVIFGLSAAMAGLAGAVGAYYYQFIAPGNYTLDLSIFMVAVVVLGGTGNLAGTVVGAVILGSLRPLLQNVPGIGDANSIPWQSVIYGFVLVLMMLFRPEGILPEGASLTRLWRRGRPSSSNAGTTVQAGSSAARPTSPAPDRPAAEPVVQIQGLSKNFGGVVAVDRVDINLNHGQITALIGPNGAGKTTIFNLATGVLKPDAGRVLVNGVDVVGKGPDRITRIGMTRSFQDVRLFRRITVLQNVAMAVPGQAGENPLWLAANPIQSLRQERRTLASAISYLDFVGMADRRDELVSNLSFGEQKLVAIARLLATECGVLLLDEPTSGIDHGSVDRMINLVLDLRKMDKTICIVEHSVHVVDQLADRAYFLDQGRIIQEGTMAELTSQQHLVELYFGT